MGGNNIGTSLISKFGSKAFSGQENKNNQQQNQNIITGRELDFFSSDDDDMETDQQENNNNNNENIFSSLDSNRFGSCVSYQNSQNSRRNPLRPINENFTNNFEKTPTVFSKRNSNNVFSPEKQNNSDE